MSHHPIDQAIAAYQSGTLTEADSLALEGHLEHCHQCRGRLADEPAWVVASWHQLQSAVRRPKPSWLQRSLSGLGVPDDTASLIATSPAFRPAWILAVFIVLVATAVISSVVATQPDGFMPFLAVAPLVPVLGVAVSYASRRDPVYVVTMLTPYGGLRLLLQRTLAVTAISLLLALIPGLVFMPADLSLAWLVPAIATTTSTLALGSVLALPIAATIVGTGWFLVIGAATVWSTPSRILDPIPYLIVVVLAIVVFTTAQQRQTREPLR